MSKNVEFDFNDLYRECLIFRKALENLSSLQRKYSEQAERMQQEIELLQKNAEG